MQCRLETTESSFRPRTFQLVCMRRLMWQDLCTNGGEEQSNWRSTVKKACNSIEQHPMRLYDDRTLGVVKYVGAAIVSVSEDKTVGCPSIPVHGPVSCRSSKQAARVRQPERMLGAPVEALRRKRNALQLCSRPCAEPDRRSGPRRSSRSTCGRSVRRSRRQRRRRSWRPVTQRMPLKRRRVISLL